ncbi:multidrug efflux pump [Rhodobium orientis]|uniref:Transporter n=1 Tax=Rhodobium orientis TaxID=34017 RepID=A0A327JU25_9HYPH|nr:efflux RND transporter permease subunit [Rhodobium orientis]MBB4302609.1 multidrug efflux pump [Rhodobium orientis]MBK5951521.1 transporter [Rhodobium orientis]RAI29115.1 transporter [Rhodobium orientis]
MASPLETILQRPRTVLTMMVVMVVAGVFTYINIPKESDPDIDVPIFYVSVVQQGISPEDAERLLVRPMETALRGMDGLKEITAIASEGHAGIILEFNIDFDKDEALADVRDKVDQAKAEIPAEAEEPTVTETNFSLVPTIIVALSGSAPERTLYRHARKLKDQIESIPSVLEANLSGHREELLEVVIDTMKLESYQVTQQELLDSLSRNNQLVPAGFLDTGKGRFNVKVPGLLETRQDVYELPIKQNGEGVVTLGDVAEIRRTFKDASRITRVNGERAINLEVVKRLGTNVIENNAEVRRVVAAYTKNWPDTIKVHYLLDKSKSTNEILQSLQSSIMTAIFLVMALVVAALGLRSSLLVGIAIPTSFMVGFLMLGAIGMTVNMMVMFGLVLTVGMLVDGAIVIVEYADRKIHEGMHPDEAYVRAAKLMLWPIMASTGTTLAAFLPLLLWPGVVGEFMSYLPIMVVIVLSAALVTAMIFLPATGAVLARVSAWVGRKAHIIVPALIGYGLAAALFLGLVPALVAALSGGALTAPGAAGPVIDLLAANMETAAIVATVVVGTLFTALLFPVLRPVIVSARKHAAERAERDAEAARKLSGPGHFHPENVAGPTGAYLRFLAPLVAHPIGNIAVVVAAVAICGMILMTFMQHNNGVEFFVDEEPEIAVILVAGRGNLSALEASDLVGTVENQILQVHGIKSAVTAAYTSGGESTGQILGGVQDKPKDTIGEIQIELADYCCRRKAKEIFKEIRERTGSFPGIKVEIRKVEGGPPSGKDVQLQITSPSYEEVERMAGRVHAHFQEMDGLRDIEDDRPLPGIEWQLTIDREQAGRFNAGIASVGAMVQLVTNGILIGKYRPDDSEDEVDIRARLPEYQRTLDRFDQLRLLTPNGMVPISNFVTRKPQQKVSSITRKDGLYAMSVRANAITEQGFTKEQKVAELDQWLKTQAWPEDVRFRFRGADEDQKESQAFLQKAMFASLFLMFIILVTQFNSFYQTFLTLSTVIMSGFGVILGMLVTGQKFSVIMTGTGVVALAGIVVNNAIVLIDTYNRFREDHDIDPIEAILKTAAQRLRPILLTTITTIAGLIPMATQTNFDFINRVVSVGSITAVWWVQLSTAVIAGLAFSTLLTLVVIPTMLAVPFVWSEAFGRWFGGRSMEPAMATAGAPAAAANDEETARPAVPPAPAAADGDSHRRGKGVSDAAE